MLRLTVFLFRSVRDVGSFGPQSFRFKKKPGIFAYSLLASNRYYVLISKVMPTFCATLGYWQVGRRQWKLNLLAQIDENVHKSATPLPAEASASLDLPEYTPITVRGRFDHSREVLIGPRSLIDDMLPVGVLESGSKVMAPIPRSGKSTRRQRSAQSQPTSPVGYFVVTPFHLADRPGQSILVNRGWVHLDVRDPATRAAGQ
ncbi:SURF1 protein [Fasciola gigantica]|uniref:SURF1-like protein n=1 Tax=Fasciola gigantica TaxID=46835 RepID=A0A504YQC3_FASGI|nr:SURF1 protein [Fasciola gigantica]